jgi:nucleotidyltransferase substrate binding protein (TIGR01987 family)
MLDTSTLNRAISRLEQGYAVASADPGDELRRDGAIQRFEYSYELCHKMLKRYLAATEATPDAVEGMSFPDLIRTGWERGLLLNGWDAWKGYRSARGTTSHTYDAGKAAQVFAVIPAFLDDARHLRDALDRRLAKK